MFKEFSPKQLKDHLDQTTQKPILLDVREPWEYERCHIAESKLVPMREIPSALQDIDPDKEVVVICHHGIRSRAVANYLAQNDYSKVINLSTGIDGWARDIDTSMPIY
ncbi:MAG: rhodanese-like domain-containing protein [Gammaproteobacteria bacterium]|nr:rhodanese-like domain-containing protein [Gammaproteobacteria bacterium]